MGIIQPNLDAAHLKYVIIEIYDWPEIYGYISFEQNICLAVFKKNEMCVGDLENRLSKHFYRTQLHMKSKSLITDELFYIVKSELMGPLVTMVKLVTLLCILS